MAVGGKGSESNLVSGRYHGVTGPSDAQDAKAITTVGNLVVREARPKDQPS